jgi:hypothetical protein
MLRLNDWECSLCKRKAEHYVDVDHGTKLPKKTTLHCAHCDRKAPHERMLSLPAPYMGERTFNPLISGGDYDTTGHAPMPDYTTANWETEHNKRIQRTFAALPANVTEYERRSALNEVAKEAPSVYDYGKHLSSPENREIAKVRKAIGKQNNAKKKRFEALKRGEQVNFRRDKVAGEKNITA